MAIGNVQNDILFFIKIRTEVRVESTLISPESQRLPHGQLEESEHKIIKLLEGRCGVQRPSNIIVLLKQLHPICKVQNSAAYPVQLVHDAPPNLSLWISSSGF